MKYSQKQSTQKGFTLVELMVSLSLFIIVVIALVGALYTVNDASRKVQAMRTVMDNLNFAMESMSRTIRTSENIICGLPGDDLRNCPLSAAGDNRYLTMDSTLGNYERVTYRFEQKDSTHNGRITKKTVDLDGQGNEIVGSGNGGFQPITSPEINIEKMVFYVDGAEQSDGMQPNVIIKFEGVASVIGGTTIPFSIQTYLSQRTPEPIPTTP